MSRPRDEHVIVTRQKSFITNFAPLVFFIFFYHREHEHEHELSLRSDFMQEWALFGYIHNLYP